MLTLTGYLDSLSECIAYPVAARRALRVAVLCGLGRCGAVCSEHVQQPVTAGDVCVKCAPGSFQELACQTSCNPCTPGYYCSRGRGRRAAVPWRHAQERLAQRDDFRRSVRVVFQEIRSGGGARGKFPDSVSHCPLLLRRGLSSR